MAFGIPEFGISERISDWLKIPRNAQGGSNLFGSSGGGQVQGVSTDVPYVPATQPPGFNPDGNYYTPTTTNPASTSGGGGGGGAGGGFNIPPTPSTPPPDNSGMLNAIRARLDEAKRTASEGIARAGEQKDWLLGYLTDQYGQLKTRTGERWDTAKQALAQEGTKLTNIYDRAQGSARRRAENAERENRVRARALNRGDSSFYDDIQAENTADLTRGLGVLDVEEADKTGALALRGTETNQFFNEQIQDQESQLMVAQREAVREYENAVAQGQALERAGVLDYGEGVVQAQAAYESKLDGIRQAAENLALQKMSLAAQIAQGTGNVNSFNAINDQLSGSLANNTGMNSVESAAPNVLALAAQAGMSPAEWMAYTQRKRPEDQVGL